MYVCMYGCMYVCIHVCIYLYIQYPVHVQTHTHPFSQLYVYIYIYIYIIVNIIQAKLATYTHTNKHTRTHHTAELPYTIANVGANHDAHESLNIFQNDKNKDSSGTHTSAKPTCLSCCTKPTQETQDKNDNLFSPTPTKTPGQYTQTQTPGQYGRPPVLAVPAGSSPSVPSLAASRVPSYPTSTQIVIPINPNMQPASINFHSQPVNHFHTQPVATNPGSAFSGY